MKPVPKKSDIAFLNWAYGILGCKPRSELARSREDNSVYRLRNNGSMWYVKISGDLAAERERLSWLKGKLPVPDILGFMENSGRQALIMSAIPGIDLAHLSGSWPTQKVLQKLAEALRNFHAIDIQNCPFETNIGGAVLLHGDACLPNFIFKDDSLSGYIDLGDVKIGNPEIDLSAAVWSLQHNLGSGYGLGFLQEYGVENADEEMVERLRKQY